MNKMKRVNIRITYFIVFAIFMFFNNLYSQTTSRYGDFSQPAQYFIGNRDEVHMEVNVWGFVNKPGQYNVPLDTDLVSLMSYAGGPREDARITRIKIVRTTTQQDSSSVIDVDVKAYVNSGKLDQNPELKPGDTIVVSGTTFYLVSKVFDLGFRIALIVQAIYMAQWYATRN